MQRPLDQTAVTKQMEGVADKLDNPRLKSETRLTLLRRQAQLGDLRDAVADKLRRDAADAGGTMTKHHS